MWLKLIHIILAFQLLIGTTGLSVFKHYCTNELKTVSLFTKAESCHKSEATSCCAHAKSCSKPTTEEKKNDCCKDEVELIKLEDDFLVQTPLKLNFTNSSALIPTYSELLKEPIIKQLNVAHKPIGKAPPDINLLQVYRI